jgi:protein involved in polysaccharide export with SLBB domain/capsular polysaccharide biosynthesis protein
MRILPAIWRGRWWVLLGGVVLGGCAFLAGWFKFDTTYNASVQLIRRELPDSFRASEFGESFKPRQFSVSTIVAMMRSPSLLSTVGAQAQPKVSASQLRQNLTITTERNTDLITVSLHDETGAQPVIDLLNLYAREVVALTQTLQQQEAAELDRFLREQLERADTETSEVNQELLDFRERTGFYDSDKEIEAYLRELGDAEARIQSGRLEEQTVRLRISGLERELQRLNPTLLKLSEARDQLNTLRVRYTEANPMVKEQVALVKALEEQTAAPTNSLEDFQPGDNTMANAMFVDLVSLRAQGAALASQVTPLEERRQAILTKLDASPEKSLQYAQIKARQQSLEMARALLAARQRETQLFAESSPGYYRLFASATLGDVSIEDRNPKLVAVTGLGLCFGCLLVGLVVCAKELLDDRVYSLGDMRLAVGRPVLARLGDLNELDESALALWRFRTWSTLSRTLGASKERAVAVGITSTRHGEGRSTWVRLLGEAAAERNLDTLILTNQKPEERTPDVLALSEALTDPAHVTTRLREGAASRIVLVCPDDWVWNNVHRAQWKEALRLWRELPNLAILAELPPARDTQALLLTESLPHVLWLSRSGVSEQPETRRLVETLCTGEARLSGVLANDLPRILERLPDLSKFGFLFACAFSLAASSPAEGQSSDTQTQLTNQFLSGTAQGPVLAPWQQRLTLGPGDLLNLSIYGRKDLARQGLPVGPDGKVSYLQAQDVTAEGLTIDELRERLTANLAQYYRNAQVIVTPAAFRSKKYYLLGKVQDRGTYPLDRPITLIEAIARARGIATGLQDQNTVEIADLPRAFVVRKGERLPVDFVKLFRQGDLSQNVLLEPEDYVYLPSAILNEVYVLGSVVHPGNIALTEGASVVGVVTTLGGFTPKAYRQRVLVVRGSLSQPQTHVVNVANILRGKEPDFPLLPRDIVYVADRPWARAEELADMAITAFIKGAIATWTGQSIGRIIIIR